MADGFRQIPRCTPGSVSLVSAEYANQLIDLLNAIGSGQVAPVANVGKMMLSGGKFILDLSLFDSRLRAVEAASGGANAISDMQNNIAILQNNVIVIEADISAIENNVSDIQNNVSVLQNNVSTINDRLDNAEIMANGSCDGNNIAINISLNI